MGRYPPPMWEVLAEPPPGEQPVACIDLGCGSGCWYVSNSHLQPNLVPSVDSHILGSWMSPGISRIALASQWTLFQCRQCELPLLGYLNHSYLNAPRFSDMPPNCRSVKGEPSARFVLLMLLQERNRRYQPRSPTLPGRVQRDQHSLGFFGGECPNGASFVSMPTHSDVGERLRRSNRPNKPSPATQRTGDPYRIRLLRIRS